MPRSAERSAVFLDRDGVIVEEVHYLRSPAQLRLLPGAAAAIRELNQRNLPVVVVTNQAGVARGYFEEARVGEVHAALSGMLAAEGARVDAYRYCPHHPTEGRPPYRVDCACRKPRPGMLLSAAEAIGLELGACFLVGDKPLDIEAGARAGCRTVLVQTGYGAEAWRSWSQSFWPDHVAADLRAAVRFILRARAGQPLPARACPAPAAP